MNIHMAKTFDTSKIACTTFYTIDRIEEEWWKRWWDAILLYFKYQEKSNMDATNQPRATDKYMMKWLWRWKDRFYWAKNVLTKLWLVESVQENTNWKFWKTYIRVNFMMKLEWVDTAVLENRTPEGQDTCEQETNAYSTEVSACNTEVNACDTCGEINFANNSESNNETKLVWYTSSSTVASIDNKQAVPQILTYEECYKNYYKKNWSKYNEKKCREAFDRLELDEEKSKLLLLDFKFFKWEMKIWIKDKLFRPKFETYISSFSFDSLDFQDRENKILECLFKISKEDRKMFDSYKQGMFDDFWKRFEQDYMRYFKEHNRVQLNLK